MKHSNAKMIALALVGILLLLSVPAGAYFQDNILAATAKIQYRISPTQRNYYVYHIRSVVDENYARYYEESVELIPVISKEVFREQPGNNNFPRNYPSAYLFLTDFAILSAGGQEDYAKKLFLQFYPQLDEAVQRVWAQNYWICMRNHRIKPLWIFGLRLTARLPPKPPTTPAGCSAFPISRFLKKRFMRFRANASLRITRACAPCPAAETKSKSFPPTAAKP